LLRFDSNATGNGTSRRIFNSRLESDAISNAIDYAKFYSHSDDAVIRVFDEAGNVVETYDHTGDFREW
jgi:hypothetical protein